MIKIKLLNNNNLSKIIIRGHAMYDDFGKDIVCASVSSIIITSVNASILIDEDSIDYEYLKDGLDITINKHDNVTDKIILNMINNLKELEKAYPKNILIEEGTNE